MPRRDLFTSVWDESVRMLELPSHEPGIHTRDDVCVCGYMRACATCMLKLYESGPFRARVSPFPRKGNSRRDNGRGYGEPFGGEFPHFRFLPAVSIVHPGPETCRIYGVFERHSGGQVAVKLNSVVLSTTVPNAGTQSSNFAAYRNVIELTDRLEKQHSLLSLRI